MDEKKRGPIRRALAFLLTVALVLGAVALVANWQKLNFDSIRRYFAYRSLERNESGQAEPFSYGSGASSAFLPLGDDLLVCSASGVRLYSVSGSLYLEDHCALNTPILSSGGGAGLVYDAGGRQLYVYRDRKQVFSLPVEAGRTILAASLSAQGRLVVVTQASGVKGSVTVYDESFQPVLGVSLSSRFITDAILSPDGTTLALTTAGQTGGVFDSQVAFYRLSRPSGNDDPDAVCSLGSNTVLALRWTDGPLRVLGENSLCFVNADGTLAGTYSYSGRYLKGFALDREGSCALLLGKYRAGSSAELVTVGNDGLGLESLPLNDQVLSLSSAGRYVSLLTADGLTIFSGSLAEPYHVLEELQGARKVFQRPDGSVFLIAGETARLYLPD